MTSLDKTANTVFWLYLEVMESGAKFERWITSQNLCKKKQKAWLVGEFLSAGYIALYCMVLHGIPVVVYA